MSWREALRVQVVEHDIYFERIAFKAIIDFPALDQITKVCQTMRMLQLKRRRDTPLRDVDSAEGYLAKIAARGRRCPQSKDVLALRAEIRILSFGVLNVRTSSRTECVPEDYHPRRAMRSLDLGPDQLWVEGSSIPTGYRACNADMDGRRGCW